MEEIVPIHAAKSALSQLVKRAAAGETVYIGAYGRAEVKLVSIHADVRPRVRFGVLKGQIKLGGDLDAPLPQAVLEGFGAAP